jgi:hypothetical protein
LREVLKNTTFADRVLFVLLIVISISGIFVAREAVPHGSDVIIEINGKPFYVFPLHTDRAIPINGPDVNMVVEIKGRKVRVSESDCPNKLCVREGWVSKGVIVCLPNKTLIIVGGSLNGSPKDIDAITG